MGCIVFCLNELFQKKNILRKNQQTTKSMNKYQEKRYMGANSVIYNISRNIGTILCTTAALLNLEVLCAFCLSEPSADTLENSLDPDQA